MGNILEEIDLYKEKILQYQYEVSEGITHQLTKGEIRERFIMNLIKESVPGIKTLNGIIASNSNQSPQIDLIIPNTRAILNDVGIIDIRDVKNVFEIKSRMKKEHIIKINNTLKNLKKENPKIKGGIICYKVDCTEQYILKDFGYQYDKELKSYSKNNIHKCTYDSIDYIVSFDQEKEFILSKDISNKYILDKKVPIISKFLMIFSNSEVNI